MAVRVDPDKIRQFCTELFKIFRVGAADAGIIADNLLEAEMRGVRSHGLVLVQNYVKSFAAGKINPAPQVAILRESAATLAVDGDHGPGSVTGRWAMARCIKKAETSGIALTTVKNGTHFGMAAYYAMMALEKDMIGIALCNAGTSVAVYGGASPVLGTNPICVAVPAARRYPLVYDGATSVAAFNKLFFAATEGNKIPRGWALDPDGNETDDPALAMRGALLPFGGYKGSGLAVIVNVFCGLLSGASAEFDEISRQTVERPQQVGFFFGAIDIGMFQEITLFKNSVDLMVDRLKAVRLRVGTTEILMPGEKEFLKKRESVGSGLEVGEGVLNSLKRIEREYPVPLTIKDCLLPSRA